ncbi:hypothetical protein EDD16DRAFT_1730498 [Pisolithus croceorrhizus]|nr:hypothetical protein EDD16DRAFT_1730498 [Pisolithus croceorrhizus]KAI6113359.1 hypothetical protein EV401DRAFT_2198742 [Pisolithus croceorrhizus]
MYWTHEEDNGHEYWDHHAAGNALTQGVRRTGLDEFRNESNGLRGIGSQSAGCSLSNEGHAAHFSGEPALGGSTRQMAQGSERPGSGAAEEEDAIVNIWHHQEPRLATLTDAGEFRGIEGQILVVLGICRVMDVDNVDHERGWSPNSSILSKRGDDLSVYALETWSHGAHAGGILSMSIKQVMQRHPTSRQGWACQLKGTGQLRYDRVAVQQHHSLLEAAPKLLSTVLKQFDSLEENFTLCRPDWRYGGGNKHEAIRLTSTSTSQN